MENIDYIHKLAYNYKLTLRLIPDRKRMEILRKRTPFLRDFPFKNKPML